MKPFLAIGPLTNLQDARSSAAVGFDHLVFSLERGSTRMIGANLVWNIASWISGPEIIIETSRASLEELTTAGGADGITALSFRVDDWTAWVAEVGVPAEQLPVKHIWLRMGSDFQAEDALELLRMNHAQGLESRFVVDCKVPSGIPADLAPYVFLHYPSLGESLRHIKSGKISPLGYFLGAEAEEEFGQLDYEAIDDWLEVVVGEDDD